MENENNFKTAILWALAFNVFLTFFVGAVLVLTLTNQELTAERIAGTVLFGFLATFTGSQAIHHVGNLLK